MTMNQKAINLTPAQLQSALVLGVLAQKELVYDNGYKRDAFAIFVRGASGVAKSSTIKGLPNVLTTLTGSNRPENASPFVWGYGGMNLANTMPEEFKGLPIPDHASRTTVNYPMSELVTKVPCGIYVMEEFDRPIVPATQASAAKMIQRESGCDWLPKGWTVVMTGNGDADGLPDPDHHVLTRCLCLYVDANGEQSQKDANEFMEREGFDPAVILSAQLSPLQTFADWRDVSEENYRTRLYASAVLKTWKKFGGFVKKAGLDFDAVLLPVLAGLVGVVRGREIYALAMQSKDLPTFGQVLNSPDTVAICAEIDKATPYLDSLIRLCTTSHDAKQVSTFVTRHHAEVARCALQKMLAHKVDAVADFAKNDQTVQKFFANS